MEEHDNFEQAVKKKIEGLMTEDQIFQLKNNRDYLAYCKLYNEPNPELYSAISGYLMFRQFDPPFSESVINKALRGTDYICPGMVFKAMVPFFRGKAGKVHILHVLPSIFPFRKLVIYKVWGGGQWSELFCSDTQMKQWRQFANKSLRVRNSNK
jgi:hypothetical protein